MKKLKVNFGGSHRSNAKCLDRLAPYRVTGGLVLRATLGSNRMETTVWDTPEMRETLKAIKGSVSRHQPEWLNKPTP